MRPNRSPAALALICCLATPAYAEIGGSAELEVREDSALELLQPRPFLEAPKRSLARSQTPPAATDGAAENGEDELWNTPEGQDALENPAASGDTPPPGGEAQHDDGDLFDTETRGGESGGEHDDKQSTSPMPAIPGERIDEGPSGSESAPPRQHLGDVDHAESADGESSDAATDDEPASRKAVGGEVYWDNHLEMGEMIGYGSMGVCEAVTAPLGLIPTVGTAIGLVLDLACLYPGALSIDYISLYHGDTNSALWQAATAVILAKIWRVGTRIASLVLIGTAAAATLLAGAVVLGGAGLSAFLGGSDLVTAASALIWAPTLMGSVIVASGFSYILLRKVRKAGQGLIYQWTYVALSDKFETPTAQATAQEVAYVRPPLGWWERAWVLLAMADGSEPEFHYSHLIPVVGRIQKAGDAAEALKGHMRKVGKDVVVEQPEDLTHMDNMIDGLAAFEGGLSALSEAALIAGGVLCTLGLGMAAAYFLLDANLLAFGLLTTGVGVAGLAAGGAGVLFLLLREVPQFVRPFLVTWAYGPVPYDWMSGDKDDPSARKEGSDDGGGLLDEETE